VVPDSWSSSIGANRGAAAMAEARDQGAVDALRGLKGEVKTLVRACVKPCGQRSTLTVSFAGRRRDGRVVDGGGLENH
jgi:hypothetical protein